jgi:transposase
MYYYGLDVHKNTIEICKLFREGTSRETSSFPTSKENIREFAKSLREDDKVVLEATFNSWSIYEILKKTKAKIVVANARQVKAIAHAKIKTDKVDAHTLAQLLRADFIPDVHMPDEDIWQLRQLMNHRRLLGKQRTSMKNTLHGILNKNLIKAPADPFTKKGRTWLKKLELTEFETLMRDNALTQLEAVEKSIDGVDFELKELVIEDPNKQLLLTIPGVDIVSACGLMAVIGDVSRFKTADELSAYFGLVPRISQSGEKAYYGRITKTGSSLGRWFAVECAQSMAMSSAPLAGTYHRVKNKKGHNVAVVALARKLIVLIWHMLTKKEPYRYAPSARTREKLRKLHPALPALTRDEVGKRDINEIYKECGLWAAREASTGEKRTAANNRRTITRLKKNKTSSETGRKIIEEN